MPQQWYSLANSQHYYDGELIMALKKNDANYELLIRFNDNGKIGAHLQSITTVSDGADVLSVKINDPEPMTLDGLQSFVASFTEDDWFVPEVSE